MGNTGVNGELDERIDMDTMNRSRTPVVLAGTTALKLERALDGRLCAQVGNERRVVRVQRCFPWSEPDHFISLRDDDDQEFALVADPSLLDTHGRAVLQAALSEAGFIFDISAVIEI